MRALLFSKRHSWPSLPIAFLLSIMTILSDHWEHEICFGSPLPLKGGSKLLPLLAPFHVRKSSSNQHFSEYGFLIHGKIKSVPQS